MCTKITIIIFLSILLLLSEINSKEILRTIHINQQGRENPIPNSTILFLEEFCKEDKETFPEYTLVLQW